MSSIFIYGVTRLRTQFFISGVLDTDHRNVPSWSIALWDCERSVGLQMPSANENQEVEQEGTGNKNQHSSRTADSVQCQIGGLSFYWTDRG